MNFDNHLKMHHAESDLVNGAGWRLRALLRAARFFTTRQMIILYKSQILSFIEAGSICFFHAPKTTMDPLERIQRRFLREIGILAETAFLKHNLAPVHTRCDIAALGLLHKRILGICLSRLHIFSNLTKVGCDQIY